MSCIAALETTGRLIITVHMLSCLLSRAGNTQCVAVEYNGFGRAGVVVLPAAATNVT